MRLVAAFLLALGLVAAGPALSAHAASVSACAASPSHSNCDGVFPSGACTSGTYYVVDTAPLINSAGESSNSYGYVQLWWSKTCQTNWSRLVINVSGLWFENPAVHRQTGSPADEGAVWEGGPGAYLSPMVYAPDTKACAYGGVETTSGVLEYHADAGQYTPCYS
jgi:hypothetical protein